MMPSRFVIRPAELADVDHVAPLFDAYRQFYGAEPDLRAAREFLVERLTLSESVVLLACVAQPPRGEETVVVGFTQLYPSFSSLALSPTVVLNDLFVVPEWRGAGVAQRLLDAVAAYARRAGAVQIELATQRTNHRALRLYEKHGYLQDTEFTHLSLAVRGSLDPGHPDDEPPRAAEHGIA